MNQQLRNQVINELEKLTTTMNIPIDKKTDVYWLLHNAAINNNEHKSLKKVIQICQFILKENNNG